MPVLRIDSTDNQKVKALSMLLKSRSERMKNGVAIIENEVMLREAMACGVRVKQVFFAHNREREYNELISLCEERGAEIFLAGDRVMKKLTALETPQGVSAVIDTDGFPKLEIKQNGRYILCERMSDPGNLGTVIRTADAMGFDGVILTKGSVDPFSPKVMRSTMGSIFRLPVMTDAELPAVAEVFKKHSITTIAAVLNDRAASADTITVDGGVTVFIGNEASGLTEEAVSIADISGYIPMAGNAESLNAAVAAAMFMWIFRKK